MLGELIRVAECPDAKGFSAVVAAQHVINHPRYAFVEDEEGDEDAVSHYALRVALARSDHTWNDIFVRAEVLLFRARLRNAAAAMTRCIQTPHRLITLADTDPDLTARLLAVTPAAKPAHWVVVPWTAAGRLVAMRGTVLRRGNAYVHVGAVWSILEADVRRALTATYAAARRRYHAVTGPGAADPDVAALFEALAGACDYHPSAGGVGSGSADIEDLDRRCYPLCMRNMERHLRTHGRLGDDGRRQYGLFLKAVGLSVRDAAAVLGLTVAEGGGGGRRNPNLYNLRHLYGLEGSKIQYAPMGCARMIRERAPVAPHCHGCPFNLHHRGAAALASDLAAVAEDHRLEPEVRDAILRDAAENRPVAACARMLGAVRGPEATAAFMSEPAPHHFYAALVRVADDGPDEQSS